MKKLSKMATLIQRITLYFVIPSIIIERLLSLFNISATSLSIAYHEMCRQPIEHDRLTLPFIGKCYFFIFESVPAICLLLALFYFLQILTLYKKGVFFAREIIDKVGKITVIMLAWSIYQLLFNTIASVIISVFKPAGQRYICASAGFDNVMHFFIVFILFMTLHLIQEAYNIKSEQDLVV